MILFVLSCLCVIGLITLGAIILSAIDSANDLRYVRHVYWNGE